LFFAVRCPNLFLAFYLVFFHDLILFFKRSTAAFFGHIGGILGKELLENLREEMRSCDPRIHGDLEEEELDEYLQTKQLGEGRGCGCSYSRAGFVVAWARFPRGVCASFSAFRKWYPCGARCFPFRARAGTYK
jgi:hypothetical protein